MSASAALSSSRLSTARPMPSASAALDWLGPGWLGPGWLGPGGCTPSSARRVARSVASVSLLRRTKAWRDVAGPQLRPSPAAIASRCAPSAASPAASSSASSAASSAASASASASTPDLVPSSPPPPAAAVPRHP